MNQRYRHKAFVYAALLLWLFATGSGMHGHFCFDGMEPPVSVHFDLLSEHDNHPAADDQDHHNDINHHSAGHKDMDSKPALLDVLKLSNPDLHFLATLLLLVIVWPAIRGQKFHLSNTPSAWRSIVGLRPPLRAPPIPLH